jgi:hypothetical protein
MWKSAKSVKITLATRNPVVCEFMERILAVEARFVSKKFTAQDCNIGAATLWDDLKSIN